MGKINVDLEMPLDGVFKETKSTYRPDYCQDCVLCLEYDFLWCGHYHKRTESGRKPEWCKVSTIVVTETL